MAIRDTQRGRASAHKDFLRPLSIASHAAGSGVLCPFRALLPSLRNPVSKHPHRGPRSLPSSQLDAFQSNQTVRHAWDLSGPPAVAFTPVRVLQVHEVRKS